VIIDEPAIWTANVQWRGSTYLSKYRAAARCMGKAHRRRACSGKSHPRFQPPEEVTRRAGKLKELKRKQLGVDEFDFEANRPAA
jgi:hypothetical protein